MRLLNVGTYRLESFDDPKTRPPYTILSHRWREEEILFEDLYETPFMQQLSSLNARIKQLEKSASSEESVELSSVGEAAANPQIAHARLKKGWSKLESCCAEAMKMGLTYCWIDSCCINKESSTELSEALNSMFAWYQSSEFCIAYLDDVKADLPEVHLHGSEWFKRGWTLQELIAPSEVLFYGQGWKWIGFRSTFAVELANLTQISLPILLGNHRELGKGESQMQQLVTVREDRAITPTWSNFLNVMLDQVSVATRFSWAASRVTSREEDQSYSLIGLFGLVMPIFYGEGGSAAFYRLQTEIFRATGDHSIFAWADSTLKPCARLSRDDHILREMQLIRHPDTHSLELQRPAHGTNLRNSVRLLRYHYLGNILAPSVQCFAKCGHVDSAPYEDDLLAHVGLTATTPRHEYSAFSHGLRVQLILETIGDGSVIAHLACNNVFNNNRIAICLSLDLLGVYLRSSPDTCIEIPSSYLPHRATLGFVHINGLDMFQQDLEPAWATQRKPVYINTECLERAGFRMMRDFFPVTANAFFDARVSQIGPSDWLFEALHGTFATVLKRPDNHGLNRLLLLLQIENPGIIKVHITELESELPKHGHSMLVFLRNIPTFLNSLPPNSFLPIEASKMHRIPLSWPGQDLAVTLSHYPRSAHPRTRTLDPSNYQNWTSFRYLNLFVKEREQRRLAKDTRVREIPKENPLLPLHSHVLHVEDTSDDSVKPIHFQEPEVPTINVESLPPLEVIITPPVE